MISAGNDIVSLNAINVTRTKQHRFYSKILSGSEKLLYEQPGFTAISFENFVWLLWSVKESAYKFLKRLDPGLIFTPVKVEIKQLDIPGGFTVSDLKPEEINATGFDNKHALKGIVSIAGFKLNTISLIYNSLILSVANCDENFSDTHWGIKVINNSDHDTQSAEVRKFLAARLQNTPGFEDLIVSKNEQGIPILSGGSKNTAIPVSLSHHDRLVSYSFRLP